VEKIFAAYDLKANAYMSPFVMPTAGMAIRAFEQLCRDPKTQFNQNPEDFILYELGEWDPAKGKGDWHPQCLELTRADQVLAETHPEAPKLKGVK
jgi:hypothetical protein